MKKRMLALSAVLGTSLMLLTGFDSEVTPEKMMEDMAVAMEDVTASVAETGKFPSMCLDADLDLVLNIEMITKSGDNSIPMNMGMGISGNIAMQLGEDQSIGVQANIDVSYVGSVESTSVQMYCVPDGENGYDTYAYDSDYDEWIYEAISAEEYMEGISSITEAMTMLEETEEAAAEGALQEASPSESLSIPSDVLSFTLSDEPVTVNGISCYELKTSMDSSLFAENEDELIDIIMAADLAEDEQLMVYYLLNGFYADLTYYIDIETNLPVQMIVDMSQTDLSMFEDMLKESMALDTSDSQTEISVSVSMDPCTVTVNLDLNGVPTVTVPAEALAAKQLATAPVSPAEPATPGEAEPIAPATPAVPQN